MVSECQCGRRFTLRFSVQQCEAPGNCVGEQELDKVKVMAGHDYRNMIIYVIVVPTSVIMTVVMTR